MMVWTIVGGAFVAVTLFETWCLWRVRAALGSLPRLEDRVAHLADTMALLTDTTEACFSAIGGQLATGVSPDANGPAARRARQRRVVGASKRGRSVAEIAAQQEISESEAALVLRMAGERVIRDADAALCI